MPTTHRLRVLLVEDNPGDVRLVREMLRQGSEPCFDVEHVEDIASAIARLTTTYWHVVLLDLSLPDAEGLKGLERVLLAAPRIPVVILSGLDDELLAIEAVHTGAQTYMVKGEVNAPFLQRSLRYAIERHRTVEALRRANDELRELNRMKSTFISTVSHELRTPLTSIKNALDIVLAGHAGTVTEEQGQFIGMASRNINRLTRMINDLLDLSKLEEGKISFRFAELKVPDVIEGARATFAPQADAARVALEADIPLDLPTVYSDPVRLEQVLDNLLHNAIKFTPAGGRVVISARQVDTGVEVSVSDSGPGLSADDQQRVFERFFQVNAPQSGQRTGSGLGLSIARKLVETLGGSLLVESAPGQGSRFFFTIPSSSPDVIAALTLGEMLRPYLNFPSFSVLILEPGPVDSTPGSGMLTQRAGGDLGVLRERVLKILCRPTDQVLVDPESGRLVVVLAHTPKIGAAVVKHRLERALVDEGSGINTNVAVSMSVVGPITYPDDGSSLWEVVFRTRQAALAGGVTWSSPRY